MDGTAELRLEDAASQGRIQAFILDPYPGLGPPGPAQPEIGKLSRLQFPARIPSRVWRRLAHGLFDSIPFIWA